MRRGAKPAKAKVEAERSGARKSRKGEGSTVHDLEKRLAESLEREKAAGEILRVISSSPASVQPTFEAIARAAMSLCEADIGCLLRFDGQLIHVGAFHGTPQEAEATRRAFPQRPGHGSVTARAILAATVVQIDDVSKDPEAAGALRAFRTVLSVPMIRDGRPLGAITVARRVVRPFSDEQIELVKTFADQAVIAIENVRLFKELEVRNRDLTEALDQQTGTSEILRVISSSPMDVLPTFEAIATAATRLCAAQDSGVVRFDGALMHLMANDGFTAEERDVIRAQFPRPADPSMVTGRAIITRAVAHVPDIVQDPDYSADAIQRGRFVRAILSVPMLRDRQPIGAITVTRREAEPFSPSQIAVLETFARQAVIAIENVRLFKELEARTADLTRSVEQLTALGEVGRAVSSTLDLQTVLTTIVGRAVELSGTSGGVIYEHDEATGEFRLRASHQIETVLVELLRGAPFRLGEGVTGRAAALRAPVQVMDLLTEREFALARISPIAEALGYRSVLAVPLLLEDRVMGGLTVWRKQPGDFAPEVVHLLQTFAAQSSLALQNARLFREIADKSRQLEAASQHKSEFLANMSHELRTPLNAIIGFSEVLSEKMFGELNQKQEEYSKDIHASGQHLLSLINDILDLSKIEAGRMELERSDFHLPTAIENALMLVRERAGRRSLTLHKSVHAGVGQLRADERKIRQVVLNLLSNAIKFTPEGGRIEVAAVAKDGSVEVSVSDNGVGIAPQDQERVFEEFRQVGAAEKKAEGTGLGLTLCRKFVELHGGRIWVKSQLGAGSTFTFTIPAIE